MALKCKLVEYVIYSLGSINFSLNYRGVRELLPDEYGGLWVVSQCSNADNTGGDWFVDVRYLDSVAYWPRIGQATGLFENKSIWNKKFKVFPNPAKDMITIRQYGNPQNLTADIYDLNGRRMQNAALADVDNDVDVSGLPAGIYFVKIEKDGETLGYKKIMLW